MAFDQLIEHIIRNILLQKSWRKWGSETSKKALYEVKVNSLQLVSIPFDSPQLGIH